MKLFEFGRRRRRAADSITLLTAVQTLSASANRAGRLERVFAPRKRPGVVRCQTEAPLFEHNTPVSIHLMIGAPGVGVATGRGATLIRPMIPDDGPVGLDGAAGAEDRGGTDDTGGL
jgi:hypothetical protein